MESIRRGSAGGTALSGSSGTVGGVRRVLILGKQGSGKGTQGVALAQRLRVPHVAVGDVLRKAVREKSALGLSVASTMESGDLVPDALVVEALAPHLRPDARRGFVLDGFPRTLHQVPEVVSLAGDAGIDLAIRLDLPNDIAAARIGSRRSCAVCSAAYAPPGPATCDRCGNEVTVRADDTPGAVARRLALYARNERSLIAALARHMPVATVDAVGAPEVVAARVWIASRSVDPAVASGRSVRRPVLASLKVPSPVPLVEALSA